MTDDRIEKLEMLVAHQDRQIQDLSDVLAAQRREIDILQVRLDRTQKKLVDLEQGGAAGNMESLSPAEQAARDKPPHY